MENKNPYYVGSISKDKILSRIELWFDHIDSQVIKSVLVKIHHEIVNGDFDNE